MAKLTKAQAIAEISTAFSDLANRLEDRAATCGHNVDAELHRKSAGAIRALLSAYSASLKDTQ